MDYETLVRKIGFYIRQRLEKMASDVHRSSVIKDIYTEVDISPGYFLFLTLANLIALTGLLTNSTAVIIGAMLISPLMGPILSSGFAFITGNWLIGKKALRKITYSVALTIAIASMATYLSPIQDVTDEIISRTKPNLYDLVVAFLAGLAGAIAICTKKNYITIVPGVAIATAVIPPLSVTGFGIGTWNGAIAGGGFFLFFTNFVAIIFATSLVFYLYGFKPGIMTELTILQLKKRVAILIGIFLIIAIPLIYTLHVSVSQVRLKNNVQFTLKQEFDMERRSHLDTFAYIERDDRGLEINAIVNTVDYLKDVDLKSIEERIGRYLKRDVILNVEQVRVQAGGLTEEAAKSVFLPVLAPSKPPMEVIKNSRDDIIGLVRITVEKIDKIISPSVVDDFYVGFHYKTSTISVNLKIRRDTPLTDIEMHWLSRILSEELGSKVELTAHTLPFVSPLTFNRKETNLSEDMKTVLLEIKKVYQRNPASKFVIESYTETGHQREKRHAEERANMIAAFFTGEFKIPKENITRIVRRGTTKVPTVKISVL
ncbi:MAG: DUF389 domain-containing protein [Nitrospirae bacterium]|nr:DUF389 domain-containing protein [Nitrospirota bacterium]